MATDTAPARAPRSWLEWRLRAKGLRQVELSRLSGVTRQTISDMVRGRRKPSPRVLRALARLEGLR